jgi:hypothetical protein
LPEQRLFFAGVGHIAYIDHRVLGLKLFATQEAIVSGVASLYSNATSRERNKGT